MLMGSVTDLGAYRAQRAGQIEVDRETLAGRFFAARGIPLTKGRIRELLSPGAPDDGPDLKPAS